VDQALAVFFELVRFSVTGTRQTPVEAKLVKDGKALTAKDVDIIVRDDVVVIKYKKPSHELSGPYQIKISNGQGEATKDVKINMQGKKSKENLLSFRRELVLSVAFCVQMFHCRRLTLTSPRSSKIRVSSNGKAARMTVARLSCTTSLSGKTSALRVSHLPLFYSEELDVGTIRLFILGGWENVAEIKPGLPTMFKCEDLVHKKEYKFRVRAVNKIGSSEPASYAKAILAKDPWGELRINFVIHGLFVYTAGVVD